MNSTQRSISSACLDGWEMCVGSSLLDYSCVCRSTVQTRNIMKNPVWLAAAAAAVYYWAPCPFFFLRFYLLSLYVYTHTQNSTQIFFGHLLFFLFKVASCCVRERVPAILFIAFPYFSSIVVQVGNIRETFILHYYLSIYYSSNGRQAFSSVNTPANVLVHNHIPIQLPTLVCIVVSRISVKCVLLP